MNGNLAVRESIFANHCCQGRKRAFQTFDESNVDEEGRKQLLERLDEKEEGAKRRRIECIKANGLTIDANCDKDLDDLDSDTSKLIVHADSCNETSCLSLPSSLVDLEVKDNALVRCVCLQFKDLNQLHSITIGANCFSSPEASSLSKCFSLSSCVAIQTLVIGDNSFGDYRAFVLSGLKLLKEVSLGDNAFCSCESVIVESSRWTVSSYSDCPALTTIQLGTNALQGNASSTVSVTMKGTVDSFRFS